MEYIYASLTFRHILGVFLVTRKCKLVRWPYVLKHEGSVQVKDFHCGSFPYLQHISSLNHLSGREKNPNILLQQLDILHIACSLGSILSFCELRKVMLNLPFLLLPSHKP